MPIVPTYICTLLGRKDSSDALQALILVDFEIKVVSVELLETSKKFIRLETLSIA